MPLKIAMIGAGSISFTRRLMHERKHKERSAVSYLQKLKTNNQKLTTID